MLAPCVKLAAAIALPLAIIAVPTAWVESGPSICLFRRVTGWSCPGCGMTRAVSSTLHGDIVAAIRFNRLVVAVFPLLCCLWAKYVVRQVRRIWTGAMRRRDGADSPTPPCMSGA